MQFLINKASDIGSH